MDSINVKHFIKPYEQEDDFISRPLSEVVPVQAKLTVDHLRDLIKGYENGAFVCGGYPSWLLGLTKQYGDIDIFCVNRSVFEAILARVDPVKVTKSERFVYGCTYEGLEIDVICMQDAKEVGWFRGLLGKQPKAMTIENVMETFDLSWSMVGIDFNADELVYHADFVLPDPYVNQLRNNNYTKTVHRLTKYFERRGKTCAPELIQALTDELVVNSEKQKEARAGAAAMNNAFAEAMQPEDNKHPVTQPNHSVWSGY